jgi:quinone-modifying oxidoreductase subunit QmoA
MMCEVADVTGDKGNYTVNLKISPRYVNDNCTVYGACSTAVTSEFADEFNYNNNVMT